MLLHNPDLCAILFARNGIWYRLCPNMILCFLQPTTECLMPEHIEVKIDKMLHWNSSTLLKQRISMHYRDIHFEPHEREPISILLASVGILKEDQASRLAVSLFVDVSNRPDVAKVVEAHKEGIEGECTSQWGSMPELGEDDLFLILEFRKPITTKALIRFDVARHGPLIDCLVEGDLLHLVPVPSPEHLKRILEAQQGGLYVEVYSEGIRPHWRQLWAEKVAKHLGSTLEEAKDFVEANRQQIKFRIENPDLPPFDRIAGWFFDEEQRKLYIISKDTIINQLKRDGPKVAESFDQLFDATLQDLSAEFSRVAGNVVPALVAAVRSGDTIRKTCGELVGNANQTIMAAIELTRLGYRLQPCILLRNAVETVSMALYLFQNPEEHGKYSAGKVKSQSTIGEASKVVPNLGQLWGTLSEQFAHVGPLYRDIHLPVRYESSDDEAAKFNLMSIYAAFSVLEMAAELIFYDNIRQHHYWKRISPQQYELDISPEMEGHLKEISERLSIIRQDS